MNKQVLLFILPILAVLASCSPSVTHEAPGLIPQVSQLKMLPGEFSFNEQTIILFARDAEKEALRLQAMLQDEYGFELEMIEYTKGVPPKNSVLVNLIDGDDLSEQYTLIINEESVWITSDGHPGLSYALTTLEQIFEERVDGKLPALQIEDHPEFPHRGLLLDCSRHFMSVDYVKRTIDQLAYYKMNVLHWHLTEDQGWRIEIDAYPKLTEIGAWRDEGGSEPYGGYYSKEEIKDIVAYAAERHIMVIPEIEMPGHSSAAIASYPFLSCTGSQIEVETEWGVFQDIYCAGNDSVFAFLEAVMDEVVELFPSPYIHIGGDEAPKVRWESCSKCQKRIEDEGLADEHELQSWFIERMEDYLAQKGRRIIGWDEITEGGIPGNAIVQSWRGMAGGVEAIEQGHQVIMSPTSHAYLDYGLEAIDLEKVYSFDPVPEGTEEADARLILGAEVNMWTERVTEETIDAKIYPRMIAMAEVLWSYPEDRNYLDFLSRVRGDYPILSSRGIKYGLESVPASIETRLNNDAVEVELIPGTVDLDLQFSLDSGDSWVNYQAPVELKEDRRFMARAELNGTPYGDAVQSSIAIHQGLNKEFNLDYTYSPYYTGGGSNALLNGRLGELNFRDGNWQAVQGDDLSLTVDLGASVPLTSVSANFYQYGNAWIFLPKEVRFMISDDGENWRTLSVQSPRASEKEKEQFIENFIVHSLEESGRFVRMEAVNFGPNPEWHDAPGMDSWLFCDELIIR